MKNLIRRQQDYNCFPYSFFLRHHDYSRSTRVFDTESVDMTRKGGSIKFRPVSASPILVKDRGSFTRFAGTSSAEKRTFDIKFLSKGFTEDLQLHKFLDFELTIWFEFAQAAKASQYKACTKKYYISAYADSLQENDNIFYGYDYEGFDENVPIKNQKNFEVFQKLVTNNNTSTSTTLLTLNYNDILEARQLLSNASSYNFFHIQAIDLSVYQRRLFFKINDDDEYKNYLSQYFGRVQFEDFSYEIIERLDNHNSPNLTYWGFFIKNEVIDQHVSVSSKQVSFNFDYWSAYYTTNSTILPLSPHRQTSYDTIYKKNKTCFKIAKLYPEENYQSISLIDDTNPDLSREEKNIFTFHACYNDEGSLYLDIRDKDNENISLISSTRSDDLTGDEIDKPCKDSFMYEEYYFDKNAVRNNKVVKITVFGKNVEDEFIKIAILVEVVKNTTIYELYQKTNE